MTLSGQSAGGVMPITANGECMTIAFHSQGSTNVYLTGPSTTAFWAELGYNSTAVAGFPATKTLL
jgi:hypothetical protein